MTTSSVLGAAPFTGTGTLIRLAARRDRVLIPVWVAVFAGMASISASASVTLYPDVDARVAAATTMNRTPSLIALYGRVYDETSLGALSMIKMTGMGSALVAVLAIILTVRHTRAEEESGRLELLGSTVLGRYAALTAALVLTGSTCVLLGLLTAAGLMAAGLPVAGSLAFGLSWTAIGAAFAAIAAITAQLSITARGATGLASAALGAAYLLRAIGDSMATEGTGPGWPSWLSPVGWAQQVRPFAGDRWWVLGLTIGLAFGLTALGYALLARRDAGAGLLPDRAGAATASRWLGGPVGLAWRLQRATLVGWLAGYALLGAVFGSIASNVAGLLDSPQAQEMILLLGGERGLSDAFLAAEMNLVALVTAAYGIQATNRLRAEELSLRAEPILATATGRVRWLGSHLAVAVLGAIALQATLGLAAGLGHARATDDYDQVVRVLGAALGQLPAVFILIGLAAVFFAASPRLSWGGWAALVGFLLTGQFGPLLDLPRWLIDLSPFAHSPQLPGGPWEPAGAIWLTLIAAALTVLAAAVFRRRDLG